MSVTRRAFMLLGALAGLGVRRREAIEPSHFYQWSKGQPFTTDLQHRPLTYGFHQKVFCNGRDMGPLGVRRCLTGPNGWVDVLWQPPGNDTKESPRGDIQGYRLYGHVEYHRGKE